MRHRVAGRHLSRTSAHRLALRRNMAQSLFHHGEIRTTVEKAKEVRPFVEKLITLARQRTLRSRQRILAMLNDRAVITADQREQYDNMSKAQRARVLRARSGRRHRTGTVPACYNKKKFTFVARSVVHTLINDIAPRFAGRDGGYTRIVRLPQRRIGDGGDLALLQLVEGKVEKEQDKTKKEKKAAGRRRERTANLIRFLEGRAPRKKGRDRSQPAAKPAGAGKSAEADAPATESSDAGDSGQA